MKASVCISSCWKTVWSCIRKAPTSHASPVDTQWNNFCCTFPQNAVSTWKTGQKPEQVHDDACDLSSKATG